jgi:hypothetical protein
MEPSPVMTASCREAADDARHGIEVALDCVHG